MAEKQFAGDYRGCPMPFEAALKPGFRQFAGKARSHTGPLPHRPAPTQTRSHTDPLLHTC